MTEPAQKPRRRQRTNRPKPAAAPVAAAVSTASETIVAARPTPLPEVVPAAPVKGPIPPAAVPQGQLTQAEADAIYLAAAEERAKVIRDNDDGSLDRTDHFWFDRGIIPSGWDYQWKRFSVYGEEDPSYAVNLQMAGWTPVPAARHPEMMPTGYKGQTIERKGQRLMEMPLSVVDRRRIMDRRAALEQVRVKETQLASAPPGTFERGSHPGAPVRIGKQYAPLVVPGDVK